MNIIKEIVNIINSIIANLLLHGKKPFINLYAIYSPNIVAVIKEDISNLPKGIKEGTILIKRKTYKVDYKIAQISDIYGKNSTPSKLNNFVGDSIVKAYNNGQFQKVVKAFRKNPRMLDSGTATESADVAGILGNEINYTENAFMWEL